MSLCCNRCRQSGPRSGPLAVFLVVEIVFHDRETIRAIDRLTIWAWLRDDSLEDGVILAALDDVTVRSDLGQGRCWRRPGGRTCVDSCRCAGRPAFLCWIPTADDSEY